MADAEEEPQKDTAFIKGGHDMFIESPDIYWWFFILTIVYAILLFVQWVTMLNINVPHTYFANPGAPGDLFSLRYSSIQAVTLIFVGTRILLLMAILSLMAFRKSYGWNVFWLAIIIIFGALQVVAFVSLTVQYAQHSNDLNRFGLATDNFYCCAEERHANPLNNCVNAFPCGPPVPPDFKAKDLRANEPFVALYWVNFFLVLLDVVWVAWLLIMWNTTAESFEKGIGVNKVDKEEEEEAEASTKQSMEMPLVKSSIATTHGLRERRTK
jgi:hypothetical protein